MWRVYCCCCRFCVRGTEPAQDMSYCRSFRLHGSHTRQLELDHTDQGYISALQDLHHELYTAVLIVVVGRDHTDNLAEVAVEYIDKLQATLVRAVH